MKQRKKRTKKGFDWTSFWRERSIIWIKAFSWYEHWACLQLFEGLNVGTCLELGGGPGYLAKLVSQKLGYELTLVENEPEAYAFFKKISNFGNYVIQDFFEYKPKEKFDLVFSFGVIEHYFQRKKRLEVIKIHKRLSNRYVAVFVPKESFFVRHFFHYPEDKGFEKLYTRKELRGELEDVGLKILKFAQNFHAIGYLCEIG